MPSAVDRNVRVLTPVLNSTTHSGQWGLRPISGEEILLFNDVGSAQAALLEDKLTGNGFYSGLLPGKCLISGFRSVFNEGGEGGDGTTGDNSTRMVGDTNSTRRAVDTDDNKGVVGVDNKGRLDSVDMGAGRGCGGEDTTGLIGEMGAIARAK
jgi:hypothetical protein